MSGVFVCPRPPSRWVVGRGIIARLVIRLHVDETSIVVNRVVDERNVGHGVTPGKRRLQMQCRSPPTACVEAMAFVTKTDNVVVYVHVRDASAGLAANRNPHSDAENVVSNRYVTSSVRAVAEVGVEARVGRRGTADTRFDGDVVIPATHVVVLN